MHAKHEIPGAPPSYLTINQSEESLQTLEDKEDSDSLPQITPFKNFHGGAESLKLDFRHEFTFSQVSGLLNEAGFPFQLTLIFQEWEVAKPESGNSRQPGGEE